MTDPTTLIEHCREHLYANPAGIVEHLKPLRDADAADVLNGLLPSEAAAILALLPREKAASIAAQPHLTRRGRIFGDLDPQLAVVMLQDLPADERTNILRILSPHDRGKLLPKLDAKTRAEAEQLLSYPEHSAGAIMTTEFVRLKPTMTVADALAHIREVAKDRESVYACYVLDEAGKLLGALSLRDLVVAESTKLLPEVMRKRPLSVQVTDDRDEAARRISKYNLLAVPVLDADGKVLGFVTVDDVIDVMVETQTDQFLKMGGVEAGALDDPYLATPFFKLIRKRATWLVILFLGELLTATAMGYYEEDIAKAVVLALFLPLIISSGGNSGSQATSLIIRALALREVKLGDWWRVLRREIMSGLLLGGILGAVGLVRIFAWQAAFHTYHDQWLKVGMTVSISLVGVVLWGTLAGAMLPFILKKLGTDPATSSAPLVATLVDVTGLIIYFTVASLILL